MRVFTQKKKTRLKKLMYPKGGGGGKWIPTKPQEKHKNTQKIHRKIRKKHTHT